MLRRVLAIRPHAPLAAMLEEMLTRAGHEFDICSGNVEAVHRARNKAIDVVITDPTSTVAEDLALAAELERVRPAVRVIVLAAEATPADVVATIRARAFACFTSPFDAMSITDMAKSALESETWRDAIQVVSGLDHWLTLRVSCHLLTADRLVRFITELQSRLLPDDHDLLFTAFREILLNAMEHGGSFDPEQVIEVTAARTARALVYHVKDPGAGFRTSTVDHAAQSSDPDAVLTSTMLRAEKGMRPGGFGMLIARSVADELVYNEPGNEVILIKHLQ